MAHAIIRTDKMFGTDNRTGLISVKYTASNKDAAIDNGNVVLVGALVDGEREIYTATAPKASSDLKQVAIIATPEITYCPLEYGAENFENKAGKPARAYLLTPGMIFSVTKEALDGAATPAVGNAVELKAGTKLNVATSATSGSTTVGKIIAVDTVNGKTLYVVQVG